MANTKIAIPTTFDGIPYPSQYAANTANHKHLGLTFNGFRKHLNQGRFTTEEVNANRQATSFWYKGEHWDSIKECAYRYHHSRQTMSNILRKLELIK